MLCVGAVRIGRARQAFWAVWDRAHGRLLERTTLGRGALELGPGVCRLRERDVQLELTLDEDAGIETICPSGGKLRLDPQAGRRPRPWHRDDRRRAADDRRSAP